MAVRVFTKIVQPYVCIGVIFTSNTFSPLIFIHLETYMEIGISSLFIYIAALFYLSQVSLVGGEHGCTGI